MVLIVEWGMINVWKFRFNDVWTKLKPVLTRAGRSVPSVSTYTATGYVASRVATQSVYITGVGCTRFSCKLILISVVWLEACPHEPGAKNWPGDMTDPGQLSSSVHMSYLNPGESWPGSEIRPRGKQNVVPGQPRLRFWIETKRGWFPALCSHDKMLPRWGGSPGTEDRSEKL